jgi:two-component system, cell cycle sensor histidine kinase and response regulator CckA
MVGLAVERDRLEKQLHQASKMEAIGILAGGIAHDFNNLLATVLGNAELAEAMLPGTSEARPMLQEIVTASVSASELCSQMLTYAGRSARSMETLECNSLVRELAGLMRVALSKKAKLVFDLHKEPLGVLADRSQVRQVIMNLIANAAEAIGDNEGRIVLGSSARIFTRDELDAHEAATGLEPGEYVHLWVSDTGSGMSPEIRARIFDPFFTTKATGRGLGLAAVQGIVLGHGGSITLESTRGFGTRFSVLLPRVPAPDESPPRQAESGPEAQGTRVLVVDDEPQVRKILGDMLEHGHYSVIRAGDGEEAIEVFRREADSIDCVLLDLSMPKLDGEEVFQELRKIREDVRVVLISGYAEQEILDRFHGTGLAGVVQKPARRQILLSRIATAVGRTDG